MPWSHYEATCSYCGDTFTSSKSQADADAMLAEHMRRDCRG
jgi:hypothetical protein